ncbi:MAG TPA: hypothetical protein DEF43_00525 [Chloroflexus aurantiacus]|nr:hypothetical protein [Chloroflexus aurantiacus]
MRVFLFRSKAALIARWDPSGLGIVALQGSALGLLRLLCRDVAKVIDYLCLDILIRFQSLTHLLMDAGWPSRRLRHAVEVCRAELGRVLRIGVHSLRRLPRAICIRSWCHQGAFQEHGPKKQPVHITQ